MVLKPLHIFLSACVFAGLSFPAQAQDTECSFATAEITKIREPAFGTSTVWDTLYAHDGMDVFSDVIPLETGGVIAAGAYTKDKNDKFYHPLIVQFKDDMKIAWELRAESDNRKAIHRILKTKEGYTVLGDITDTTRGSGIYIESYDENGKVRGKAIPIFEAGGNLDAKAIIPSQDTNGYIIAAQFIDTKDAEKQKGILYKVSNEGKILWKRSIETGRSNVFNNVQATLDGTYVITGQIVMTASTSGGWVIRVDGKGAIKWQRPYPRGTAASLQAAAQTKDGGFIFSGKARPTGGGGKGLAAWIMKTDSAGNVIWQRYLKGDGYSYGAPDLIVYEDGRASVLINGEGQSSEKRSHARLITFSPEGRMQEMEDFTDGTNASAHRLVSGLGGERILVGYAQTSFGENQEAGDPAPDYTYDGWLMAAVPLEIFDDPCAGSSKMSPILP